MSNHARLTTETRPLIVHRPKLMSSVIACARKCHKERTMRLHGTEPLALCLTCRELRDGIGT